MAAGGVVSGGGAAVGASAVAAAHLPEVERGAEELVSGGAVERVVEERPASRGGGSSEARLGAAKAAHVTRAAA